jgi:predicted nucleic acid-binding protein
MTVFVDTSALYAVLDRDDANHLAARETWRRLLLDPSALLLTHNYVLVETAALLQNRRGIDVVRTLHEMQSIFSSAARREKLREQENAERRDGELRMDWTKPPEDSRAYGH